jgi:hypothetical protein
MPKKGETLPFKVAFTYHANPAAGRDKAINGTLPFRTEDEAMREATELARRGALVFVDKRVGPVTHHLAQLYPWTDEQRRLAELADEVTELQHYDGGHQVQRMFDIQNEMTTLIAGIGVKHF